MNDTVKIPLLPINGGAFNCLPAREVEIEPFRVLANDVIFHWETNPQNVRAFAIGEVFERGALALVWADCEGDALDQACDAGLLESLLVEGEIPEEERDIYTHLGDAGELHNLNKIWIQSVDLKNCSLEVLTKFAECRGACAETFESV